jgi:hemoglobin
MSEPTPEPTLFDRIGGAEGVATMVERFFAAMEQLDGVQELHDLHAGKLDELRVRLNKYFTGWFGGPQLYMNDYGHPRLRRRHGHLSIGIDQRDQWLTCMTWALEGMAIDDEVRAAILSRMTPLADHMRNRAEEGAEPGGCPD